MRQVQIRRRQAGATRDKLSHLIHTQSIGSTPIDKSGKVPSLIFMSAYFRHAMRFAAVLILGTEGLWHDQLAAYEQGSYFICKLVDNLDETAPAKRLVAERSIFKQSVAKKSSTQAPKTEKIFTLDFGEADSKSDGRADSPALLNFGQTSESKRPSSLGFSTFDSDAPATISSSGR